jgi:hypothetical protein
MEPVRRLARWFAGVLRSVARALDEPGAGRDRVDAATAALAVRFPGAPEHWLRYIATRAPHLAQAPASESQANTSENPRVDSRRRWWWPRPAIADEAAASALRDRESGPVPAAKPAKPRDTKIGAAESRRAASRPRLRIVESPKPQAMVEQEANPEWHAEGSAAIERPRLVIQDRQPTRRAHLRLAKTRAASDTQPAPAWADKGATARPQLALPDRPQRESDAVPYLSDRRLESGEVSNRAPTPLPPARKTLAERTWMSGALRRPGASDWPDWTAAAGSKSSHLTPFGHLPTRRAVDPAWSADTQDLWPKLPPLEPIDINNAPVGTPNVDGLRAEQDAGSWSG